MSWAKIYKVNSDFSEPLNFLSYIQDISINKNDSYVFHKTNHQLFQSLYMNSFYLFASRGLKSIVYQSFSDDDIDNLFNNCDKLGEKLNLFYELDVFNIGEVNSFISDFTPAKYNLLEEKFRQGYIRYVTKQQESENVGKWYNETFNLKDDSLNNCKSIEEILLDKDIAYKIFNNKSALFSFTICLNNIDKMLDHDGGEDSIFSTYCLENINNPDILDIFLNNIRLCNLIIKNEDLMTLIISNEECIKTLFIKNNAIDIILSDESIINKLISNDFVLKNIMPLIIILNSTNKKIYKNLKVMRENLSTINGSITVQEYNNSLNVLNSLDEKMDEIIILTDKILNNEIFKSIIDNPIVIEACLDDRFLNLGLLELIFDVFTNNLMFIDTVLNNETIFTKLIENKSILSQIFNSPLWINSIAKSVIAKNLLCKDNDLLQNYKLQIHEVIKNNSSYFKVVTNGANSDSAPSQTIKPNYIGVTYCYGYNGGTGKYGVVYHGHDINIEAGRSDGAKTEDKKYITLGGTKYMEVGDGYFTYYMYEAL